MDLATSHLGHEQAPSQLPQDASFPPRDEMHDLSAEYWDGTAKNTHLRVSELNQRRPAQKLDHDTW